ncbi:MAG: hypothetical protein HZB67_02050 [Candidatus Aenigmarchaeota archaeon]|nr:hypothetical protein [Candidatus Aenigmarchaeota archaeon]
MIARKERIKAVIQVWDRHLFCAWIRRKKDLLRSQLNACKNNTKVCLKKKINISNSYQGWIHCHACKFFRMRK